MKPGKIFAIGTSYAVAIFLFMLYPQYLAFSVSLVGIGFLCAGLVVFPKYSARFEMRLPDLSAMPAEQRERVATGLRIQGRPVAFGDTRILPFRIRTVPGPVITMAITFVFITYVGGFSRGMADQRSDAQMLGGVAVLYFCLFLGGPLIALSMRWFNERKVLNSAGVQFVAPTGNARGVRYDFRDSKGHYFGTTSLRFDRSWAPGELDIVLYSPQDPERSYTASSFFFHRVRRDDLQ